MVQALANGTKINSANTTTLSGASLEQNSPNPFNQSTTRYTLPAKFVSAQIVITDQTGKVLKQSSSSTTGKGILNIQAGSLVTGTYSYTLFIDIMRLEDGRSTTNIRQRPSLQIPANHHH